MMSVLDRTIPLHRGRDAAWLALAELAIGIVDEEDLESTRPVIMVRGA
jgi:hypothetical protein